MDRPSERTRPPVPAHCPEAPRPVHDVETYSIRSLQTRRYKIANENLKFRFELSPGESPNGREPKKASRLMRRDTTLGRSIREVSGRPGRMRDNEVSDGTFPARRRSEKLDLPAR